MVTLREQGVYYQGGQLLEAQPGLPAPEQAMRHTMCWQILSAHNTSADEKQLSLQFDSMSMPDNAYGKLLRQAEQDGLQSFAIPCVLANDHNSLCVGNTSARDLQQYGLKAAQAYGGVYLPAHLAVVHQYMREQYCSCGALLIGSDDHVRYGALGAMGVGKGGDKQVGLLLGRPYETAYPQVVAVHLTGRPAAGIGPMDLALAILGAVKVGGFVKNKVLEFIGDGISQLTVDTRNGVDSMTAEMGCWSTIWQTDDAVKEYYRIHGRPSAYRPIAPSGTAYYDGAIEVALDQLRPMIAMPFSPDHVYEIQTLNENLMDILNLVEQQAAKLSENPDIRLDLKSKVKSGKLYAQQGVITGCVGGTFENICAAADILGDTPTAFPLSVYPASQPIYVELMENGVAVQLLQAGASLHTAFCGPCSGACDVPENGALSLRHAPRNVLAREGAKPANGQIAGVALMDARSIAASARSGGAITPATAVEWTQSSRAYQFRHTLYAQLPQRPSTH